MAGIRIRIGWAQEPPVARLPNAVEVEATLEGRPVEGELAADVSFGSATTAVRLEAGEVPTIFRGRLTPTRAGTYTFHITGTLGGRQIEITSTCSPDTFDCVVDGREYQFPAADPSIAELESRLDRGLARAERDGSATRALSIVSLLLATGALAVTVLRRTRRTG